MSAFRPWRLLHLNLDERLPVLHADPASGGVFVVLWAARVPLGHMTVPADQLPIPAHELQRRAAGIVAPALGDHLFAEGFRSTPRDARYTVEPQGPVPLDDLLRCDRPLEHFRELWQARDEAARSASRPAVSVVICTRDRPDDVERCLSSLGRGSRTADEIIVVDNAPATTATRHVVESFPGVRYLLEPKPGLSAARNTGVRAAAGEIIAFTDDDVEVHEEWVARLAQAFRSDEVLAVTGLVLPAELRTESQWIFESELGGFSQGYRQLWFDAEFYRRTKSFGVPAWRVGAGANMAFRRRAFQEVGLFHELLGAGAAGCSEDSDLWYRLLVRGWSCRYDPALVVFHRHRADLDALQRQMHAYMKGHVATLLLQAEQYRDAGNLYRLALTLPWHYAKRGGAGLVFGYSGKRRTTPAEIRGCLAGVGYYLRHRRARREALPKLEEKD
jgi:GT2 family glycosyltransferase